jgi:hypothetical protein
MLFSLRILGETSVFQPMLPSSVGHFCDPAYKPHSELQIEQYHTLGAIKAGSPQRPMTIKTDSCDPRRRSKSLIQANPRPQSPI